MFAPKIGDMKKILLILSIFIFISCTSTRYIEVPVERIKLEYRDIIATDSSYIHDSIITREIKDTVFIEKYRYKYIERVRSDTFVRTDTVTKTVPVEVIKEVNRLKEYQVLLMIFGSISIVFVFVKLLKSLNLLKK